MKRRIFAAVAALALLLCCAAPVFAASDYGYIYDATSLLSADELNGLSTTTYTQVRETYGIELRTDIVRDLEGFEIDEYAALFYDGYSYGAGDGRDGILLMLYVEEDAEGLVYRDHTLYGRGRGRAFLDLYGQELEEKLDLYLNTTAWLGGLDLDETACVEALQTFAGFVSQTVQADGVPENTQSEAPLGDGSYIVDEARLLTDAQRAELEAKAAEISQKYDCGVYVMTVDDFRDASPSGVYQAATTLFNKYAMGLGEDRSGVMLLLSMDDRDYSLIAHGYGNTAFTDYGKEVLADDYFLDDFRRNDWYGGFTDYVDGCGEFLQAARAGDPVDVYSNGKNSYTTDPAAVAARKEAERKARNTTAGVACAAVGAIASGISCGVGVSKMKSVRPGSSAERYTVPGSMRLNVSRDQFTHNTVSRVRIQSESSRSSGGYHGGGTHSGGGGFSGHSGKF